MVFIRVMLLTGSRGAAAAHLEEVTFSVWGICCCSLLHCKSMKLMVVLKKGGWGCSDACIAQPPTSSCTEYDIEMTLALPGGKEINSDIKTMEGNKRILWISVTVGGLDVCPFDGRWKGKR